MYKLTLNNFADRPVIILRDGFDMLATKILRSKAEVDFEVDKIQKEVQNREETLKDLLMLKEELRE